MSHYTSIKTKYSNPLTFKDVLNKLNCPYVEYKNEEGLNILEIFILPFRMGKTNIYNDYSSNYLAFHWDKNSYNMVTDLQSWTQKESIDLFLKKLEVNYGYCETVKQAVSLGFTRSKIIAKNSTSRFVFQRYVEIVH
uniref:Uncharacterized protein n=1 Tax=Ishige okamurae TaxID=233772 RepID=A0A8E6D4Z1_9PHAE|nr:hypothetical protein Ycf35 [Ishige okamurae]QVJ99661.1 hypothetical protein Ycf35 [Ishige okamurae]